MRILNAFQKFKKHFRKKGSEFWGISENIDPMNTECTDWSRIWQLNPQYMKENPDDVEYAECYKRSKQELTQCRDCWSNSSGKCEEVM